MLDYLQQRQAVDIRATPIKVHIRVSKAQKRRVSTISTSKNKIIAQPVAGVNLLDRVFQVEQERQRQTQPEE